MASPASTKKSPSRKHKYKPQEVDHSKHTIWILAAIAKIKGQKQRPDETRISHILFSSYGVPYDDVMEHLELCVQNKEVLRVSNKGKNSYKDPARQAGIKGN